MMLIMGWVLEAVSSQPMPVFRLSKERLDLMRRRLLRVGRQGVYCATYPFQPPHLAGSFLSFLITHDAELSQ